MAVPREYLEYPKRRYGMDQEYYTWSPLPDRPAVEWPGGARVALWITTSVEFFPFNSTGKPFRAPGALLRPYPNYWEYSQRDYGLRIGIFRILKLLDQLGIRGSAAVNAAIAQRFPSLLEEITGRGMEILAQGHDMDRLLHGGMSSDDERALITESLAILRSASGQAVDGWVSPARSQSWDTPVHLAAAGVRFFCDYQNDDMPFPVTTPNGNLWHLPLPLEYSDWLLLINYHCSEDEYAEQILDAFSTLRVEAEEYGGRILALTLTPSIIGLPYRIGTLRRVLAELMDRNDVWLATGAEILEIVSAQHST